MNRYQPLDGWLTYLSAVVLLIYAATGMFLGKLQPNEGVPLVIAAFSVFGLRRAVKKAEILKRPFPLNRPLP